MNDSASLCAGCRQPCSRRGDAPGALPARQIEDSEYRELESALRPHGGVAACETVTELLRSRTQQPISRLARWIVGREVLSVQWGPRLMVPLFQFDRISMMPLPVVGQVLRELAPVLGDWSLALWFARPNALLGCRAPVDAIQGHARAVADAARAQRLLVCG